MTPAPLHPAVTAALLLGWRLGLGWLLGRRFLVLTTLDAAGDTRRSVVRYAFAGGNFYVPADGGTWQADLAARHTCTVQAHPGPKGVAGSVVDDPAGKAQATAVLRRERPGPAARMGRDDIVFVFSPTGERVPEMLLPDLVWVWAPVVAVATLARSITRRR